MSAPLIVLGVSRSGTTLLRVMLDRSPGIAIPDESFFVPLLARRHGRTVVPKAFLDDLSRIPNLRTWGVSPEQVAPRLRTGMKTGEAISAIFESYAAQMGKPRWGDKTPMYMRHLPLLEKLFPKAQYVHLIRDGRDAALSFVEMPEGTFSRTWAHPSDPVQFACLWRKEVGDARVLGRRVGPSRYREVRYEDLVAATSQVVGSICDFVGLPFVPEMIEYAGAVDVSDKPHQQRLLQPPTLGVRSWRDDMNPADARAFEKIAGDRLSELGYELRDPLPRSRSGKARATLGWYSARLAAWNAVASAFQRSPMWRRRHPPLSG